MGSLVEEGILEGLYRLIIPVLLSRSVWVI